MNIPWCPDLHGRTAIVTGAARYRGIGRQIALELARQGVNLILTGTGRAPADYPGEERDLGWNGIDSVLEEVRGLGADCAGYVLDVGDGDAVGAFVQSAKDAFGTIDYLINNAGAAVGDDRVPLHQLSGAQWRRVMRVNLDGAFNMASTVAQHLVEQGRGGAIVNISSIASRQCLPTAGAYAASKAALNAMSRTMALELAPHAIRVNALLPGLIRTSRITVDSKESWEDLVTSFVPLKIAGDGSEIANMCAFLCSARGQWITGQDIAVDGGSSW